MINETITSRDGFEFEALRFPAIGLRKGGLILIQEIFGLNSYMREAGERFAKLGFEVLVPSMFDRQEKGFSREGHDEEAIAMGGGYARANGLEPAMSDIGACIDALDGPIFVSGFCYGGSMAYFAACQLDGIAAASCYYGSLLPQAKSMQPKCPTIAHFGRRDGFIPMDGVEAFRDARSDVPTYVYEAGHGFARENSEDYDSEADALAMQRTLDLYATSAGA